MSTFRGIPQIADVSKNGQRVLLPSVRDIRGNLQSDRKGIVGASAGFYEQLYSSADTADCSEKPAEPAEPVTAAEITANLKNLRSRKSSDAAGIFAEMLKLGGTSLSEATASLSADILVFGGMVPET